MNKMQKSINILSIEGNIGSGKSTVINTLKLFYKNFKNIYFLEEPVSEWLEIKDLNGKNILENFYENKEHYSFSFQIMAYISRLSMLKKAINYCKENDIYLIVCERSLFTDKNIFCKMLYDDNKIEEINYQIYLKWFDEFITDIPITYFLYIQTDSNIAYQRVLKRNRKGENIDLDYLEMCNKYHDDWLIKKGTRNSFIINGNLTSENIFNKINDIIILYCSK